MRENKKAERMKAAYEFIKTYIAVHGYSPSYKNIGVWIGVKSTYLIQFYLDALQDEGLIIRDTKVSRSIRVLK